VGPGCTFRHRWSAPCYSECPGQAGVRMSRCWFSIVPMSKASSIGTR
jgi:hypothetical protein